MKTTFAFIQALILLSFNSYAYNRCSPPDSTWFNLEKDKPGFEQKLAAFSEETTKYAECMNNLYSALERDVEDQKREVHSLRRELEEVKRDSQSDRDIADLKRELDSLRRELQNLERNIKR